MSVYREKEQVSKKSRDSSKPRREESRDRRPIITQEKSVKLKPTTSKEKPKIQTEKQVLEKQHKRNTEISHDYKRTVEKERKSTRQEVVPVKVKRHESQESRKKSESRMGEVDMKYLMEKKSFRKSDDGSGDTKERKSQRHGGEEKLRKSSYRNGTTKLEDERKAVSRRDRTRTRTLSPTEVKQLIQHKLSSDILSREKKESVTKKEEMEEQAGGEDEDYEDDFEDYESDFEEDDESESPKTPPQSPSKVAHTFSPPNILRTQNQSPKLNKWESVVREKEIKEVKKCIEKENDQVRGERSFSKSAEDSDKENTFIQSRVQRSEHLIDFSRAAKNQKKAKEAAAIRRRGEELLSMISLDAISYTILEIPAIPYEDFMKAFGKSNTKQAHVQTNEDSLDAEIQTDDIQLINKWTQSPPEYLGSRKNGDEISYVLTKEERLGVGADVPSEEEFRIQAQTHDLWRFLSWASQMVLTLLERRSGNFLSLESMPNHSKAMAFGDGFVNLNVNDVPFLKGRSIAHLRLPSTNSGRLLSVHVNKEKSFQKSMICVWSLRELSKPLKILVSSNRVSSCCFGPNEGVLVFAGLSDGSICLWDLREPSVFHNRATSSPEWGLQSATYTTAGSPRESGHRDSVVAVRLLTRTEGSPVGDFAPMQICSLDKEGLVIIWSVIQLEKPQRNAPSEDLGLAHWGRVKLVKSSSFSVFAGLREEIPGLYINCKDMLVNEAEEDGFYVGNSLGSVHHCSSHGAPMKPKFYLPGKEEAIVETTCLEMCPFDGNYFLVGCGDGTIRLHSRHQEKPLICLDSNVGGKEREAAVVSLAWMRTRPCVFFALDSLSRINIWDLGVSDIYPEVSLLLTQKKITCMNLLPVSDPRQVPFVVVGTEGGSVEIHRLKKQYGSRTEGDVRNEMKMFLKYVSIL